LGAYSAIDSYTFTGVLTILACFEILRRAQSNLFHLENEQLNNPERFRPSNVPNPLLPALKKKHTYLLVKMLNDEDEDDVDKVAWKDE
jgi:hypothetical protein